MRCNIVRCLHVLLMFAVSPFPLRAAAATSTHPTQAKLEAKVSFYSLEEQDFAHGLFSFASKFQLPMGIEWVRSAETTKKISLSWKDKSVQQMLEMVVSRQAGYKFDIGEDGVVHVFPAAMHLSSQDFLNLRIDRFEVQNEIVELANHRLHDLVSAKLSPRRPQSHSPAGTGYSQGAQVGDPEFSLALTQVPVREVLDRLALASDRKIWVVTFVAGAYVKQTGYLRTITLWNNAHIPDAEQPIWNMLRWNDRLP